jgi:hypothetical protein
VVGYIAEGAGGLVGALGGAIPAAIASVPAATLTLLEVIFTPDPEYGGGVLRPHSTPLLVAVVAAGAGCVVGGTAAGVCIAGKPYTGEVTGPMGLGAFIGSAAGWASGITLMVVGGNIQRDYPANKSAAVGGAALKVTGVLAIPTGAVVGYNLFARGKQNPLYGSSKRLLPPSIACYSACTEDGLLSPGVRAQLVTVSF